MQNFIDVFPALTGLVFCYPDKYIESYKNKNIVHKKVLYSPQYSNIFLIRGYVNIINFFCFIFESCKKGKKDIPVSGLFLLTIVLLLIFPSLVSILFSIFIRNDFILNAIESLLRLLFLLFTIKILFLTKTGTKFKNKINHINNNFYKKSICSNNWVSFTVNTLILSTVISIIMFSVSPLLRFFLKFCIMFLGIGLLYESIYHSNRYPILKLINTIFYPISYLTQKFLF